MRLKVFSKANFAILPIFKYIFGVEYLSVDIIFCLKILWAYKMIDLYFNDKEGR